MTQSQPTPEPENSQDKPRRKRRGRWWKILLVLLLVLVVLLLLLPSIASTAPVRNMVLGRVNANLPGKLEIQDWSLGWFSATKASGVKWIDSEGHTVATVAGVDTQFSLLQVARGDLHLGEIVVRGVDLDVVVPVGESAKKPAEPGRPEEPQRPAPSERAERQPINIPDAAAKIRVVDVKGKITFRGDRGLEKTIAIEDSTHFIADWPGGSSPASVESLIAIAQTQGRGTIAAVATANGLRPGPLDLKAITATGNLEIERLDLDEIAGILRAMGVDISVKGILGGKINLASAGPGHATLAGGLRAHEVVASTNGENLRSSELRIPVDAELTGGESPMAVIRQLGVIVDQGQANLTANLPLKSLDDFRNNRPVIHEGTAAVVVTVPDLPVLMNSLRSVFALQKDVQVTGGRFEAQVNLHLGEDGLNVSVPAYLRELSATRQGRKIGPLEPVTLEARARIPTAHPAAADISDIFLQVKSSFMNLDAAGATLGVLNAESQADLVRLRDDFGAIVDLSMIRGGRFSLSMKNQVGARESVQSDLKMQLADLGLDLKKTQGAAARRIDGGSVQVSGQGSYENGVFTLVNPLKIEAGGRVLQQAKNGQWATVLDESLQMSVSGSADIAATPKKASISQFVLAAGKQPLARITQATDRPMELVFNGKRGIVGEGRLNLQADIAAIQRTAAGFSAQPAAAPLERGTFTGDLVFSAAREGAVRVALEKIVAEVAGAKAKTAGNGSAYVDRIEGSLEAKLAADDSSAQVSANVAGKLARLLLDADAGMIPHKAGAPTLKNIRVSKLEAQTSFAQVSLVKPFVISDVPALLEVFKGKDLPENTDVSGELLVKADLARLPQAPVTQPSASAFAGQLSARHVIALKQRDIVSDIAAEISDFAVQQNKKTVVSEPKITLAGGVRLSPAAKRLALSDFGVSSSSGMLNMKIALRVGDLGTKNAIEEGRIEFAPDWSKLWPVVYAALPPENQVKIGELVMEGKQASTITLKGSYPTDRPYEQAIKSLIADGDIAIEKIDYKKFGVVLGPMDQRFTLKNGQAVLLENAAAQTRPATGPATAATVAGIPCNDGELYLDRLSIDLTGDTPRLNGPRGKVLARDVKLNSVLVASLGVYANALLVAPEKASGTVSARIVRCDKLALSTQMYDPKDPGVLEISIFLKDLDVAGKNTTWLLDNVLGINPGPGKDRIVGNIKDGRVKIANGRVVQNVDLQLGDWSLGFKGDMTLVDNTFHNLTASVPAALLSNRLRSKDLVQYLPERVGLQFSGPANNLRLDPATFSNLTKQAVEQQLKARLLGGAAKDGGKKSEAGGILGDILGGEKPTTQGQSAPPAESAPSQPQGQQQQQPASRPADAVDTLIDLFGGSRKK